MANGKISGEISGKIDISPKIQELRTTLNNELQNDPNLKNKILNSNDNKELLKMIPNWKSYLNSIKVFSKNEIKNLLITFQERIKEYVKENINTLTQELNSNPNNKDKTKEQIEKELSTLKNVSNNINNLDATIIQMLCPAINVATNQITPKDILKT